MSGEDAQVFEQSAAGGVAEGIRMEYRQQRPVRAPTARQVREQAPVIPREGMAC